MKKILLICGASETIINFRKSLILFLKDQGYDVSLIMGDTLREEEVKALGVEYHCVPFSNRSKNIFKKIKFKKNLTKLISNIHPDIVLTFQLSPNTFGVFAAHKAKIDNIYSVVEGLGDPFQPVSFKDKLVEKVVVNLYKKSFKHIKKAFFLNHDDKFEFLKRGLISKDKAYVIDGVGIDTDEIKPSFDIPKEKKVVCLARLIKNKGIIDYCEVARMIRKDRKDIIFELYGEEAQLTLDDIKEYIDDGSIVYGGYSNDPHKLLRNARILSSTSYREGFPMVILESMALARPVVVSNVIGNHDVAIDNVTGFITPAHYPEGHAKKILELIDDEAKLLEFGKNARRICEERYSSKTINRIILSVIDGDK